jgi:drug/metabolite transporter (DMT)-like permease
MMRTDLPLRGIALMLVAMAVLPFLDVLAKTLGNQGVPVLQIVWARMAFGAVMTLPFALQIGGARALVPDRPAMHALRAALLIGATAFFFQALRTLPIADALAIFFVQPLVITMFSPLILGESVGWRRWAAVAVGFVGVLIIIRPGFQAFDVGMAYALLAGASLAFYMLMTRRISGQAHAMVTTFQTSLLGGAMMTALVLVLGWQGVTPAQWAMLVGVGLVATVGHFLIVKAYDNAEASLLAPLGYTEMIMAVVLGWAFFGDFPDGWTFVGVGILIASAIYISMRERARRAGG